MFEISSTATSEGMPTYFQMRYAIQIRKPVRSEGKKLFASQMRGLEDDLSLKPPKHKLRFPSGKAFQSYSDYRSNAADLSAISPSSYLDAVHSERLREKTAFGRDYRVALR
jgi:hypothetical protein